MPRCISCLFCLLIGIALLTGCQAEQVASMLPSPSPAATAVASATPPPGPTAVPTLAADARVAGVHVGGLDSDAAIARLNEELAPLIKPLELQIDTQSLLLRPEDIDLAVPVVDLLAMAWRQQEQGQAVRVPLRVELDETRLRQRLSDFSAQTALSPTLQVLSTTDTISRSFAYVPERRVPVDDAVAMITARLSTPLATRRIILERAPAPAETVPQASFAELQPHMEAMAAEWEGIAAYYLQDMESGETLTYNAETVFSGASMMKVAIMLHAYINLSQFDEELVTAMEKMIIESDNLSANDVLAMSVSGQGTDDALVGVLSMNDMLRSLGFEHTYMNMPYEGYDYLVGLRGATIQSGPPQEGPPPYTEADPLLRTTPTEITRLFLMIDDCRQGTGLLLERYPRMLSASRCTQMMDLLARNNDTIRMVAGIPDDDDVRVEHKSGWVQDMHADVGFVRSPGGDFLLAVFLWRDVDELPDPWAAPVIASFARLAYTAYNPEPLPAAAPSEVVQGSAPASGGTE